MAIDHFSSGRYESDVEEVKSRANSLRDKLEDMGIRVVDMKFRAEPRYEHLGFKMIGSNLQTQAVCMYSDKVSHTVEWTLQIGDRTASDFVELAEKYSFCETILADTEKTCRLAQTDLRAMRERIKKLECTLKENPGIRDQWDEMMTMLKLAGYTDNLVE